MRLYLVEDNALIRRNLMAALNELVGAVLVGHADNEREACDWLTGQPAAWDLAIIDIFLRQGAGFGVLQACRKRDSRQKIAVLSNYATAEVRQRCAALGADAVFDKATGLDLLFAYCAAIRAGCA